MNKDKTDDLPPRVPPPCPALFLVKLECEATVSVDIEIEAASPQEARDAAEARAWDGDLDGADWVANKEFIRSYAARAVSCAGLPATGAAATGAAANHKE